MSYLPATYVAATPSRAPTGSVSAHPDWWSVLLNNRDFEIVSQVYEAVCRRVRNAQLILNREETTAAIVHMTIRYPREVTIIDDSDLAVIRCNLTGRWKNGTVRYDARARTWHVDVQWWRWDTSENDRVEDDWSQQGGGGINEALKRPAIEIDIGDAFAGREGTLNVMKHILNRINRIYRVQPQLSVTLATPQDVVSAPDAFIIAPMDRLPVDVVHTDIMEKYRVNVKSVAFHVTEDNKTELWVMFSELGGGGVDAVAEAAAAVRRVGAKCTRNLYSDDE